MVYAGEELSKAHEGAAEADAQRRAMATAYHDACRRALDAFAISESEKSFSQRKQFLAP